MESFPDFPFSGVWHPLGSPYPALAIPLAGHERLAIDGRLDGVAEIGSLAVCELFPILVGLSPFGHARVEPRPDSSLRSGYDHRAVMEGPN